MRNVWNVKNQSRPDLLYVMICAAVFLAEVFLAWRQSVRYGGGYMSDVSLYVKIARRNPTPTRAVNWLFAHLMDLCGKEREACARYLKENRLDQQIPVCREESDIKLKSIRGWGVYSFPGLFLYVDVCNRQHACP